MRRGATLTLLTVLALVAAGGCSSATGGSSSDESGGSGRPLQGNAGTSRPLKLDHAKLVMTLPQGFSVEHNEATPREGGCTKDRSTVMDKGGDQVVALDLVAMGCSTGKPQGPQGNGDFGNYVVMDDVTDPIDPQVTEVPAGTLTTFGEKRYVCTNSCKDEISTIGLLVLEHPANPAFPSLMLLADAEGDQRAQLVDAAKRITQT